MYFPLNSSIKLPVLAAAPDSTNPLINCPPSSYGAFLIPTKLLYYILISTINYLQSTYAKHSSIYCYLYTPRLNYCFFTLITLLFLIFFFYFPLPLPVLAAAPDSYSSPIFSIFLGIRHSYFPYTSPISWYIILFSTSNPLMSFNSIPSNTHVLYCSSSNTYTFHFLFLKYVYFPAFLSTTVFFYYYTHMLAPICNLKNLSSLQLQT